MDYTTNIVILLDCRTIMDLNRRICKYWLKVNQIFAIPDGFWLVGLTDICSKKNSVKGRDIRLSELSGCGRLRRLHIDVG